MLKESYPYYLASEPHYANTDLDVTNKYTGEVATKVAMADAIPSIRPLLQQKKRSLRWPPWLLSKDKRC